MMEKDSDTLKREKSVVAFRTSIFHKISIFKRVLLVGTFICMLLISIQILQICFHLRFFVIHLF